MRKGCLFFKNTESCFVIQLICNFTLTYYLKRYLST
jgi:hypothetical protein